MDRIRVQFRTLGRLALAALFALLPVLVLLPVAALAEKVETLPQPTDYVSDFAHVLSPGTTARLDRLCLQLDQQAKAKVAVVTVQSLDGQDAAGYANALEDHWKMGDKKQNRMAMVLLAVSDHKYRIEIASGLEGILPDGKTGDMGREMVPHLRQGDYDGAISGAVDELAQVIAADAHVALEDSGASLDQPMVVRHRSHPGSALAKLIFIVILLIVFGGFSLLRMLFGWGLFFGGWGGGGWRGGGWGSGGGGDGGGGGFGGFGGGGGGFDGGGSGGSW
jgi:uncharacterized protein